MSQRRLLSPAERMVDVFDRASTLNFTVVAKLRGQVHEEALRAALRAVELRHPLLRARIAREGKQAFFVLNESAPIPLHGFDAAEESWRAYAEPTLAHRVWDDAGPRAELTWLRHGTNSCTLLLCLHHLVSDASSGILVVRDLVRHLRGELANEVVPSPGQHQLYPKGHGSLAWKLRAGVVLAKVLTAKKPLRFAPSIEGERSGGLLRFTLEPAASRALAERAKRDGATVHGVLCAALIQSLAKERAHTVLRGRILHPVDLRRALPGGANVGHAVGYYVSSLTTDHQVAVDGSLPTLAREISLAVRAAKARDEHLLSAPLQGPWLTQRVTRRGDLKRFRDYAEQKVMFNTMSLTNLGRLEPLGVQQGGTPIALEDLFYVAAGSVLGTLGASASSFGGSLSLALRWVTPAVEDQLANALFERASSALRGYVGSAQAARAAE